MFANTVILYTNLTGSFVMEEKNLTCRQLLKAGVALSTATIISDGKDEHADASEHSKTPAMLAKEMAAIDTALGRKALTRHLQ